MALLVILVAYRAILTVGVVAVGRVNVYLEPSRQLSRREVVAVYRGTTEARPEFGRRVARKRKLKNPPCNSVPAPD